MRKSKIKHDHLIDGFILVGIGAVLLTILFGVFGKSGETVKNFIFGVFGQASYAFGIIITLIGVLRFFKFKNSVKWQKTLGMSLMLASLILIAQGVTSKEYLTTYGEYLSKCYTQADTAGGFVAGIICWPIMKINFVFAIIVFSLIFLGGAILAFFVEINAKISDFTNFNKGKKKNETYIKEVSVGSGLNVIDLGAPSVKANRKKNKGESPALSYIPLDQVGENSKVGKADSTLNSIAEVLANQPKSVHKSTDKEDFYKSEKRILDELEETKKKQDATLEALNLLYKKTDSLQAKVEQDKLDEAMLKDEQAKREAEIEEQRLAELEKKAKEDPYLKYTNTYRKKIVKEFREKSKDEKGELNFDKIDKDFSGYNPDANPVHDRMGIGYSLNSTNLDSVNSMAEELQNLFGKDNQTKTNNNNKNNLKSDIVDLSAKNTEPLESFEDIIRKKNEERKANSQFDGKDSKKDIFKSNFDNVNDFGVKKPIPNNFVPKPVDKAEGSNAVDDKIEESIIKRLLKPYVFPSISLLQNYNETPDCGEDLQEKIRILESKFDSFGINARVINVVAGPTFTRLELQMPSGIPVSKVNAYSNDIAMCLEAESLRFQLPIPGKNAFGIELPNKHRGTIGLKSIINSKEFITNKHKISMAVGKNCDGENFVIDLTETPHMLIAGSTGAGKSVCINTLLCSIMYKYSPNEVKFLLVDPKQVELNVFNGVPHMLLENIVSDKTKVVALLDWLIAEMELRYSLMSKSYSKSITDYNAQLGEKEEKLPYIVLVVDEVADIVTSLKKDFESRIATLAAKARAAGIVVVLATQRPSVDVITGTIKNNLPSRIAFRVSQSVDSRTILDYSGAEKLLGKGDMLLLMNGSPNIERVQGAFISGKEVETITRFCRDNNETYFDPEIEEAINGEPESERIQRAEMSGDRSKALDPLFIKALYLAVQNGGVSMSKLLRRFSIGYPRAGKIVDQMESLGYVSAENDKKRRECYLSMEKFMELYGDQELE